MRAKQNLHQALEQFRYKPYHSPWRYKERYKIAMWMQDQLALLCCDDGISIYLTRNHYMLHLGDDYAVKIFPK